MSHLPPDRVQTAAKGPVSLVPSASETLMALGQLHRHEQEIAELARKNFPKRYRDVEKAWGRLASALSKS